MKGLPAPLLTCWPVVTEAAWLLRRNPRGVAQLFEAFRSGVLGLLSLDEGDMGSIAAIMERYADASLQLADASLVHLADREGVRTLFTLDRRDFSIVRLKRNRTLRLIPVVP